MSGTTSVKLRWRAGDIALASIAGILALVLLLVVGLAVFLSVASARAAQERIGAELELEQLREGDCVEEYSRVGGAASRYVLVRCDVPHAAELVYIAEFGGEFDVYLGQDASSRLASSVCDATMRYRLNLDDSVDDLPDPRLLGIYQSRANWEQGKTQFFCFLVNEDGTALVGQYYRNDELG